MSPAARRRLAPEDRREQLLDAALALAAGGDVSTVSVEDLAAQAGVSEGLLYHYFPTKQALVVAAVRRAADAFLADLHTAAGGDGSPVERLTAGLGAYLDHVEAEPNGWRAIFSARTGELLVIAADIEQQSMALVTDALGIERPSPTLTVALAAWAALERETCLGWLEHPDIPRVVVEDLLLTSFLATITAVGRHDPEAGAAFDELMGPDPP